MRKQPPPEIQPPQVTYQVHDNTVEQHRKYRIITPLFGGGAIQQMSDEITTVRGTEVRGHLRFWWRATCAGHLPDVEAVKKREDLIWGKANKRKEQGPKREETIQIEVSLDKESERVAPFELKTFIDRNGEQKNRQDWISSTKVHPYAAFPLQFTQEERKQIPPPASRTVSKEGIEFTLTITFPREYADEVKMALWAWETFGGVGARTRRGFGALRLLEVVGEDPDDNNLPPSPHEAKKWLKEKLEKLPAKNHGFPFISSLVSSRERFRIIGATDPMNAWEALIEKLRNFRQGSDGRSPGSGNKPGRSYWPEAEAVRELTGSRRSDLPARGHPQKFPRAAFGLPITFHFMRDDQHNKNKPGFRTKKDPADAFLQSGGGSDRLASPLILKPLFCQNGQACGLAVILDGYTIPSSLMLKGPNGTTPVKHQLDDKDLRVLSSLKLNNKVGVLEAFLDYLERN